MAWKKGQSGNPAGPKSEKAWRDAIILALGCKPENMARLTKSSPRLRKLAELRVQQAENGDDSAIRDIGDRLDGKPKQQTEVTGADGGALVVEVVERGSTEAKPTGL